MAKKSGSEGMTRQTTAEWAADTKLYPEGHRLMDTETGTVRVSKGTTYALAWVPSGGSGGTTLDQDIVDALEAFRTPVADAGNPFQTNADLVTLADNISTVIQNLSDDTDDALALKADIASIPQRYKFTGDGGAATGTIGVNTFPMAVTVTNPSAGDYRFTAASGTPFTAGKTYVTAIANDASNPLACKLTSLDSTSAYILIFDATTGTPTDPSTGYLITIETEP